MTRPTSTRAIRLAQSFERLAGGEGARGSRGTMAWIALLLGCLAMLIAAIAPPAPALVFLILLAFTCFGPGAAFVSLIRFGDWASSWAMAFIVSLALSGATADLMLWTHNWHPLLGYTLLALPTVGMAATVLLSDPRSVRRARSRTGAAPPAQTTLPAGAAIPAQRSPNLDVTSVIPRFALAGPDRAIDATTVLSTAAIAAAGPRRAETTPRAKAIPTVSPGDETAIARIPAQRSPRAHEEFVTRLGRGAESLSQWATRPRSRLWRSLYLLAEGLVAAVTVGAWVLSLTRSSASHIGDYGLLSAMHPAFFVAVGLCALRFVVELARPQWNGRVLIGYTILLVLIMHATVPLLVYEPEYAWSYKHVGVIELFQQQGHLTNTHDLYQQWPTFFATVAHLAAGSGLDALRVAAWAPVFFDLAFCLPIFAIARTLATDRRVPYLTVFVFTAINWVAQDYLSPQAFTYVLCLGTLFIMLRWLRRTVGRGPGGKIDTDGRRPGRIARLWTWVSSGLAEVPYTATYASRAAIGVLYLVYAVVVASHQLSPYVIAMSATALVMLGLVRPLRIVPILLIIAILYLLPRYQIADNYGLFDGFNFFRNARSAGPVLGTTDGRVFSAHVVQFLSLTVWGLGALTVLSFWRRPGPVAAPAVLAFSPFGLLLAQSYGGEAIYRVYLFSVPWFALLIATLTLKRRWLPASVAVPGAAVVLSLAILASMQGAHGQLSFNQFTRAEVEASTYLYTHAEPGADIVVAAGNFPTRLTASYPTFAAGPNSDRSLLTGSDDLTGLSFNQKDLPIINAFFDPTVPSYLVFSPAMRQFLHYFGYLPDGSFEALRTTIANSPNWRLYYQKADVYIYRYAP